MRRTSVCTIADTGGERVETTARRRRLLFAGLASPTPMGNERLSKRAMFGEVGGGQRLLQRARIA